MNATCADGVPYRSGDPLFMTSLARGLHVIRALLEAGGGQTIAELSRTTGLHRAVVRRCLYTLGELGYASREGRAYCLQAGIAILDRLSVAATPIGRAAQPLLQALSRRLGERSSVVTLDDGKVIYLACAEPNGATPAPSPVGPSQPVFGTAAGRVLLASLSRQQAILELPRIERATGSKLTLDAQREVVEIVSRVRADGYALVEEDLEIGARALAVPVRSVMGVTVAAMELNIRAPLPREELIKHHLPLLKTAAVALGRGL